MLKGLKFKWRIKILQQRMLGVFLAQDSVFRRNTPVDAQRIIQDADTTVRFRMIEVVTLVLENRAQSPAAQKTGDDSPPSVPRPHAARK